MVVLGAGVGVQGVEDEGAGREGPVMDMGGVAVWVRENSVSGIA